MVVECVGKRRWLRGEWKVSGCVAQSSAVGKEMGRGENEGEIDPSLRVRRSEVFTGSRSVMCCCGDEAGEDGKTGSSGRQERGDEF